MPYNFPPATKSIVGLAGTAAANNNILDSAGTGLATDTVGYHSISIAIVGSAGIASGQIIFECSDDGTNWVVCIGREVTVVTASPITAAFAIAASANRRFECGLIARYFRVRISTLFAGGTISAWATLADAVLPQVVIATNATAANLLVTATASGNYTVVGAGAHDAAASGNPVQVGGVVRTAIPTTLVAGDTSRLTMTTNGNLLIASAEPENYFQTTTGSTAITATTDNVIITSGGASIRNYLVSMHLYNTSISVSTVVYVKDISTIIWAGALPAYTSASPNSKIEIKFAPPLRGTANSTMNFACATSGASVYANFQGFRSF